MRVVDATRRSPDGGLLITKLGQGVKIWTRDGVCQKTIDRGRSVHFVTWMHDNHCGCKPTSSSFSGSDRRVKDFLSVEGSEIIKLDVNGKVSDLEPAKRTRLLTRSGQVIKEYCLQHLDVHSITIAEDSNRFIAVASLLDSASRFKPRKCRVENRIVGMHYFHLRVEDNLKSYFVPHSI